MMIVGLTGGIGSGKSTVASFFEALGIPVYVADTRAKYLMNQSAELKQEIIELLGEEAYKEELLDRPYVAARVFNDRDLLEQLNALVHPRVGTDFQSWAEQQKAAYVIKEAAILFENGNYKACDYTILVTAPEDLRVERVMKRDQTTEEAVQARMAAQWPDEKKRVLADFIIENIDLESTKKRVVQIHENLLKRQ
ncbi:dephospho-CoA kinase [Croceiramulus getboli]|nr:dephospho-CoA kinase [Flavobacteriaceae bacterium YJPT1-3]